MPIETDNALSQEPIMHDDDFEDDSNGSGWTSPGEATFAERQEAHRQHTREALWCNTFSELMARGDDVSKATRDADKAVAAFDRTFAGK